MSASNAIECACQQDYPEIVQVLLNWRGGPEQDKFVYPTLNNNRASFLLIEKFRHDFAHLRESSKIFDLLVKWKSPSDSDGKVKVEYGWRK